jgi:hypothetical protein
MHVRTSKAFKSLAFVALLLSLQIATGSAAPMSGKLRTRDNRPVLVNGNSVRPGTTIFSGARIQSPAKIGATIDLSYLGRVDMAPHTDLIIIFDATKIEVQLKSGYVVLTTSKGIAGKVTTSEGKVFETDMTKQSSVVARTVGSEGPEVAAPIGAAAGGLGAGAAGGVGAAGAAVVGGAAATKDGNRGRDLSTDKPQP